MPRLVLLLVALASTSFLTAAPASAADMDCGDFATQAEAQAFLLSAGPGDPHGLDADGDGVACDDGRGRRERARVVRVSDGDTLVVVTADGAEEHVRLIGIDTPEVYGRRECGGAQASRTMRRLAPVGSRVLLVADPTQADRDRYGRLLRYVHRAGRDVGRVQVARGRATVYVYGGNPFRRTASYQRAEHRAAAHLRGTWATCWR